MRNRTNTLACICLLVRSAGLTYALSGDDVIFVANGQVCTCRTIKQAREALA